MLRFAASGYVSPSRNRGYDLRDINAPPSVKQRHPTSEGSLAAPRDNPPRSPRRSASAPAAPRLWPTPRDLRARNPLSQKLVRTPHNANAPAGRPGRSLFTALSCRRRAAPQIVLDRRRSDFANPEPERQASVAPWTSPVITPQKRGTSHRPWARWSFQAWSVQRSPVTPPSRHRVARPPRRDSAVRYARFTRPRAS
jgi:hypothetical protein